MISGTTIKLNMKVFVIENKNLLVKEYLNKIKPYLRDIIIDLQKSGTKIVLTIVINFMSSKDIDEEHVMNSKCDNREFDLQ